MKNNLAMKFIAILLCACALFAVVGSTVGILAFVKLGIYEKSLDTLKNQQMSRDLEALANRIVLEYAMGEDGIEVFRNSYLTSYDETNEIQIPEDGMWFYELVDHNTQKTVSTGPGTPELTADAILYKEYLVKSRYPKILDSIAPEDMPVTDEDPEELVDLEEVDLSGYQEGAYLYPWDNPETGNREYYVLLDTNGSMYKVQLYMLPGAYEQKVAFKWELLESAHRHRFTLFLTLAAGLLLSAVCMSYLCNVAGKKQGQWVGPQALNKVPLDLYLAVNGALVYLLTNGYVQLVKKSFVRESAKFVVVTIGITGLAACVLAVGFLFACVAQMKQPDGYWWRHSVLYNFFKLLLRALKSLVRLLGVCLSSLKKTWRGFVELLPLTWQWILWVAVMCAVLILAVLHGSPWVIGGALLLVGAFFFYALHAYRILLDGAKRMSQGDLDTQIDKEQLMAGFAEFATHLNALADVAVVAAQKQMKSERMRAELITNVSHDIKTPLTSIINYVDLLKKAEGEADRTQYLEVLGRQSQRMKKLIDDLIELSKASTGNMPVDLQTADAVEYLNQAIGEFSDKLDAVPLTPIFAAPPEPILISCDSRLTWRVLSNLFSNAVKYALPDTRLYIDVEAEGDRVYVSLKNISREQLNVSSEELMERFVRGDTSRNTEGSGLGLNIAQSLMELQKGQLQLLVDGDLFKATMVFARAEKTGDA